jgi:hypothetical protein
VQVWIVPRVERVVDSAYFEWDKRTFHFVHLQRRKCSDGPVLFASCTCSESCTIGKTMSLLERTDTALYTKQQIRDQAALPPADLVGCIHRSSSSAHCSCITTSALASHLMSSSYTPPGPASMCCSLICRAFLLPVGLCLFRRQAAWLRKSGGSTILDGWSRTPSISSSCLTTRRGPLCDSASRVGIVIRC